jgi:WD40 repeat protein
VEAWSPDGQRIVSLSSDGELNVVDVASGRVTALPEANAALDGGMILGIKEFSPQGDRILYEAGDGSGGDMALWSIGVDGSGAHLLVDGTTQGDWRTR